MVEYKKILILILLGLSFYVLYVYLRDRNKGKRVVRGNNNVVFDSGDFINPHTMNKKQPFSYVSAQNGKNKYLSYNGKQYPYKVDLINDPDDHIVTNQVHPDYMRIVAYLNSRNKQPLFNFACLPIVTVSTAEKKDVFPIFNRLVYELSKKTDLGLSLVDIQNIKKFLVENQEKVRADLIIHKNAPIPSNVKMILRASYVYNNDDVIQEDDFFSRRWDGQPNKKPLVDELFIIGYVSNTYDIESQAQLEYYAFNDIEDNKYMEEGDVNRLVRAVHLKHAQENGCLNTDWDEDGKNFHFKDKMSTYTNPNGDLDSTKWGLVNRRNEQAIFAQRPSDDNLYPSIGTAMLDV